MQNSFALAFRFALREMRSGLRGFIIFIACIALGVGAIGGINGLAKTITTELSKQSQQILAGDMRLSIQQRPANEDEMAFLKAQGEVSTSIFMNTMARKLDGSQQILSAIKAVDDLYPLYGTLKTAPIADYQHLFAAQDGRYGIVVSPLLLERLNLKIGDPIRIGEKVFTITATVEDEPDLLSEGFQIGPRLFMSKEALEKTGLLMPGSLFAYIYKIKVPQTINDEQLVEIGKKAESDFPDTGWRARTRVNASPELGRSIDHFAQFLTLIGLTSLIVGGVGINNAVRAYLNAKKGVIATLKSVGASGKFITLIYYIQIMLISLIGILFGLLIALAIPFIAIEFIKSWVPTIGSAHIDIFSLLIAILFALLTTSAFAALPLGKARNIPVTALFRSFDEREIVFPSLPYLIATIILFALIAIIAYFTAYERAIALIFMVAILTIFIILYCVAKIIQTLAYMLRHRRSVTLRLALGNIYRKGSVTPSIVLALGLGLTLLVAIATLDGNLRQQIGDSVPKDAPTFFILDIPQSEGENFANFVHKLDPQSTFHISPLLRARIIELNSIPVNQLKVADNAQWVIRGDRRVSYSEQLPDGAKLAQGQWWDANDTRLLVSFSKLEADRLNLKIGDSITVNILGRSMKAEIYNLRDVDWDSFQMNFVMIFSQQALKNAPHSFLATLKTNSIQDAEFMRKIGEAYPSVTLIPLKDVLQTANNIIEQIGLALRASASIALIASILVLAGALAASNQARLRDAIIMKTLGATRKLLMRAYIYEYALLGVLTALFAFLAGSLAGIYVCRFIMKLNQVTFLPQAGIMTLLLALFFSIGLGLIGTWRILGQKPANLLK